MKKWLIIALSFLLCVTSLFGFVGCGKNSSASSSENSSAEENVDGESNIVENGYYLLADFENYQQVTQVKNGWSLGKITMIAKTMPTGIVYGKHLIKVSENTEMITRGNQCIKVEIMGKEELWGKRDPYLGFKTNGTYFQKYDFTDCESILVDIYNASNEILKVKFYVHDTRYEDLHSLKPYNYSFELKQGANAIELPLDAGMFAYPPAEGIFANVGEIGFIFDRGELHEEMQVIYMDNLRAKMKA